MVIEMGRWSFTRFIFAAFAAVVIGIANAPAQQVTPPADQPAPAAAVSQWPQRVDSPDGLITIYQPQPSQFEGDLLTARAAVSLTPPGATDPEFGAMWFTARVSTDRDARIVTVQNITIKQVKLPNSAADAETKFGQVLQQQVPSMNLMLSLDQLESTLSVVQKAKDQAQQLDNTPPKIIFTTTPTTLVVLDGPPKLQAAADAGVMTVVNTPFIILFDGSSKRWFLKAGDSWMVAPEVTGPWTGAGNDVPAGVADAGSKLTDNSSPATAQTAATQILVAEQPTEIISSQGAPTYTPLVDNDLLYMSSTSSDVFLEVATQNYYTLLSGRWFMSKSLEQGPWSFVSPDKLPAAFARIPPDSVKADVLASIAGTQQAKDARMDAFIPQTTAIRRDSGASLTVSYDGDPQFVPVDNLPITYASNCADPVLDVNNAYYCCHQAVWYQAASALGPWTVSDSVPQVIYTLPPSCPVYNCRYVYVYDSTPDVVYCGYLQGYTGCYVYDGTVVYGTGYQYPYWYRDRFIPHPYTWGFGARYDNDAGTWGLGVSVGYNSSWFANRPEHHDWFGPQGYVGYSEVHDRYQHVADQHAAARNVSVTRINLYNREENQKRNIAAHTQAHPAVEPKNQPVHHELPAAENNVYVGQDGAVYRRGENGWETHDARGWSPAKTLPGENDHAENQHPENEHPENQHPENQHTEPAPQHNEIQHEPIVNSPARETPQRQEPVRNEQPEQVQQPNLDEERAARERGNQSYQGKGPQRSSPAAQPHSAGGGGGGGGNAGNAVRGGAAGPSGVGRQR